ncbi:MAG: hypothetical protein ACI8XO_000779 [Verrucomicrobiales bacterium]|jgi:hypothetical protein
MFRLYDGVGDLDPLDPDNFDAVQSAIRCQRFFLEVTSQFTMRQRNYAYMHVFFFTLL